MANTSEVWKGVISNLTSDSTLTAMLGASNAVYRNLPAASVVYPLITFSVQNDPQNDLSDVGSYRANLQFNVYAEESSYLCDDIYSHLQDNWTIPKRKPASFTTTNYRVKSWEFGTAIDLGELRRTSDDMPVRGITFPSVLKFVKRNAT